MPTPFAKPLLLLGASLMAIPASAKDGRRIGDAVRHGVWGCGSCSIATPPRRAADVRLSLLWNSETSRRFPRMLYPTEVAFVVGGLAIYDFGEKRVHIVDAATGEARAAYGRRGGGPGEFGDRPVWFFGGRGVLGLVEASDGRILELRERGLHSMAREEKRRWMSACSWSAERMLLQELGHETFDYFVLRTSEPLRVVDSLMTPWPRLRALPFIVRQARLRQLDDSSCGVIPVYHREIAVWSHGRPPRVALQVEALPEARSRETRSAAMRRSTIAPGARSGALDARRWRDRLVVLFEGTSPSRRRILDLFDWYSLAYVGSLELPHDGARIAVSGDTLAVVGERDGEPVVSVFRVEARANGTP